MADYRRYHSRRARSSNRSWGRFVAVVLALIVVLLIAKAIFLPKGATKKTSTATTNTTISLVTDTTNTVAPTNTSANLNTNTPPSSTSGWTSFSTTTCPTAISTFGTKKRVVLTMAISAANEQSTAALNAAKATGVPFDIFVTGSFATKNPDTVKQFSQAGYPVYSQSYDGSDMALMKDVDAESAITKAETAIQSATGIVPKPLFRPPAGSYSEKTITLLRQHGYCAYLWTVDAYDWQGDAKVETSQQRVMDALDKQAGGAIVALHAGYDITAELISSLVTALKAKGWDIVSSSTLLSQ